MSNIPGNTPDEPEDQPDPISFRLPPEDVPIDRKQLHIPVKKVGTAGWFRAHPDPQHSGDFQLIEIGQGRDADLYLVLPGLASEADAKRVRLVTGVSRDGEPFLLRLSLLRAGMPENTWITTGLEVADAAKKEWVRGVSNGKTRTYDLETASANYDEPEFPPETLDELVLLAFKSRLITDIDHEILRRQRGEI